MLAHSTSHLRFKKRVSNRKNSTTSISLSFAAKLKQHFKKILLQNSAAVQKTFLNEDTIIIF
jgi:hypothetical protein